MAENYTLTGLDLAADVKVQFGDESGVQITDEMILRWINKGVRDVTANSPYLERVKTTNLLAGRAEYDLNTILAGDNMQSLHSVMANGVLVTMVPFNQWQTMIATKQIESQQAESGPRIGTEFAGRLSFWPVPKESISAGLTIYFTADPKPITALSETLPVPDRFYNSLSKFCLSQAYEMDESGELAATALEQSRLDLAKQVEMKHIQPTAFYPQIVLDEADL